MAVNFNISQSAPRGISDTQGSAQGACELVQGSAWQWASEQCSSYGWAKKHLTQLSAAAIVTAASGTGVDRPQVSAMVDGCFCLVQAFSSSYALSQTINPTVNSRKMSMQAGLPSLQSLPRSRGTPSSAYVPSSDCPVNHTQGRTHIQLCHCMDLLHDTGSGWRRGGAESVVTAVLLLWYVQDKSYTHIYILSTEALKGILAVMYHYIYKGHFQVPNWFFPVLLILIQWCPFRETSSTTPITTAPTNLPTDCALDMGALMLAHEPPRCGYGLCCSWLRPCMQCTPWAFAPWSPLKSWIKAHLSYKFYFG